MARYLLEMQTHHDNSISGLDMRMCDLRTKVGKYLDTYRNPQILPNVNAIIITYVSKTYKIGH